MEYQDCTVQIVQEFNIVIMLIVLVYSIDLNQVDNIEFWDMVMADLVMIDQIWNYVLIFYLLGFIEESY